MQAMQLRRTLRYSPEDVYKRQLYDNALNESLSYDLDKAKKMFDDLKIVDYDGDGEREYMPDGQSPLDISLSLIVYADSTAKVSMAKMCIRDSYTPSRGFFCWLQIW